MLAQLDFADDGETVGPWIVNELTQKQIIIIFTQEKWQSVLSFAAPLIIIGVQHAEEIIAITTDSKFSFSDSLLKDMKLLFSSSFLENVYERIQKMFK